jgi:3-oxoacyl-[acyl-carrier protein] reductase
MNATTLADQIAIVTGASRGIGRAIARTLGRHGARVIGTATAGKGTDAIAADFREHGIAGEACVLDVSTAQSVQQFGAWLAERDITPAILVNNAGITRDNLLLRMKDEEWDAVIDTDLDSVYRMCKLCLRGMMKARYGRIVNITSVIGQSGNAGQANYAAAKAGIIGFSRALAREIGSRGITVNCVAPGFIATDMTSTIPDAMQQQMLAQISVGRLGSAEEVADAVAFLASPSAGYITGETININGGLYMG